MENRGLKVNGGAGRKSGHVGRGLSLLWGQWVGGPCGGGGACGRGVGSGALRRRRKMAADGAADTQLMLGVGLIGEHAGALPPGPPAPQFRLRLGLGRPLLPPPAVGRARPPFGWAWAGGGAARPLGRWVVPAATGPSALGALPVRAAGGAALRASPRCREGSLGRSGPGRGRGPGSLAARGRCAGGTPAGPTAALRRGMGRGGGRAGVPRRWARLARCPPAPGWPGSCDPATGDAVANHQPGCSVLCLDCLRLARPSAPGAAGPA